MQEQLFGDLFQRARAGDQAAAGELFRAAFWPLHACVSSMIDDVIRQGHYEPEDLIQEVYLSAARNLPETVFADLTAFTAWLKVIAKNKVIDLREKLRAKKCDVRRQVAHTAATGTSSYMNLIDRLEATNSTPTRAFARKEALAVLAAQLWRLPEEYRRVVQLRFVQGLCVADVAKRMTRSEPAVHMLCHRALKKLADLMGPESQYFTRK